MSKVLKRVIERVHGPTHCEEIQKMLDNNKEAFEREQARLRKYEKIYLFLKGIADEWSPNRFPEEEKRHARVDLSAWGLDFTISMSSKSHEVELLAEYMVLLMQSLGRGWTRRDKTEENSGYLKFLFENLDDDIDFDFEVHISNSGKCEVEYETIPQPDRKVAKRDCSAFMNDLTKGMRAVHQGKIGDGN